MAFLAGREKIEKMSRKQCAEHFHAEASESAIEGYLTGFEPPDVATPPAAGLVPHAGWAYSGAVAAKVFRTIQQYRRPDTFVIFGTVHRRIAGDAVYARGSWLTRFGEVAIDEDLADRLIEDGRGLLERSESAHDGEHSIEVQMPFLKHFFPDARAVPISVLPHSDAPIVGKRIGELVKESDSDIVILGTTDLTHYGDAYSFSPGGHGPEGHEWMKRNDARIIGLAESMRPEEIVQEAKKNMNACGAGAMAATVAAAKALGCGSGLTIQYTTSYDVIPDRTFRMAVGYVGMVFCPS